MGTLAVIGAAVTAVAFAGPGPGSAQVAPVGSPQGDLTGKARNRQHLEDVLGKVLTGAEGIGIKAFDKISGAQLFSEISGDHFCIRGLPLIALLAALREEGALLS